jgi:hypothetical protein
MKIKTVNSVKDIKRGESAWVKTERIVVPVPCILRKVQGDVIITV